MAPRVKNAGPPVGRGRRLMTAAQPVAQEDYNQLGASTKHAYYDGSILPELVQKYEKLVDTASAARPGQQIKIATPRINQWLKAKQRIGADSVNGIAILAGLPDPSWSDLLVVKTVPDDVATQDPATVANLVHELLVARILMNLRPLLPTFVLPLGAFLCDSMRTPAKGQPAPDFCMGTGGNPQTPYVMLEKIVTTPAGRTLSVRDYIGTIKRETDKLQRAQNELDLMCILLQVMCGLGLAQKHYKFVHYDLHDENVLLRGLKELGNPTHIRMSGDRVDYVFITRTRRTLYVPVVIDFGWSHIEFDDVHGQHRVNWADTGYLMVRQFHPWHDVFRLLTIAFQAYTPLIIHMGLLLSEVYTWLSEHVYVRADGTDYPLFGQLWVNGGGVYNTKPVNNDEFYSLPEYFQRSGNAGYPHPGPQVVVHSRTRKPLTPWAAADFIYNAADRFASSTPGLEWNVSLQPTIAPWQPAKVFVPPV